jgi:hypothetical protein
MPVRAKIGAQAAIGMLALVGCVLVAWFDALGYPLIYEASVALLGLWIGLWPSKEPKLSYRMFVALVGSIGISVVLVVVGLAVSRVKLGGYDEGGPVLGAIVIVVLVGLPITVVAIIVAAFGPRLLSRLRWQGRK